MIIVLRMIAGAASWKGNEENQNFSTFHVVRAITFSEARQMVSAQCGDEGPAPWLDETQTRIEVWDPGGPSAYIGGNE